jgi:thiamine biosynthesis lipoprotein
VGTAEVLAAGLRWAQVSGGLFDPCLGKMCELWHVDSRSAPPSDAELAAAGRGGHFRELDVDRGGSVSRAALASSRAAVDLGGIAKGYAVDRAAQALRDNGIFHALVNAGGDLVAMGVDAEGDPWKVGVRSPDHLEQMVEVLEVSDRAVATSGDYLQFFTFGGRRYHHILDGASGEPRATAMRSLTIEAATCMDADAAATALFGVEAGKARDVLAQAAPGSRLVLAV